jgi:hypothetical protein
MQRRAVVRKSEAGQRGRPIGRTSSSGPTVDPPRVVSEATEFLDRMKGTLPEQITAADLETLNEGLRFFFSKLLPRGYFDNRETTTATLR